MRQEDKNNKHIVNYTLGEIDEKGFCDLYRDGEKTNVKMLTFTPKQAKKLQDIVDKIYRENNCC